jgi:hypothetical protein
MDVFYYYRHILPFCGLERRSSALASNQLLMWIFITMYRNSCLKACGLRTHC